jgi:hypothetical protein
MIVVSVGVNDAVIENGQPRVDADQWAMNLATLLPRAHEMAGPSGGRVRTGRVADARHNRRISDLNERFEQLCGGYEVRYVDVFTGLRANSVWLHQVVRARALRRCCWMSGDGLQVST